MIALGYSLVLIIFSYLGYKHFQREAMAYKERKSCQKTL